jgi:hypothetical protein
MELNNFAVTQYTLHSQIQVTLKPKDKKNVTFVKESCERDRKNNGIKIPIRSLVQTEKEAKSGSKIPNKRIYNLLSVIA